MAHAEGNSPWTVNEDVDVTGKELTLVLASFEGVSDEDAEKSARV